MWKSSADLEEQLPHTNTTALLLAAISATLPIEKTMDLAIPDTPTSMHTNRHEKLLNRPQALLSGLAVYTWGWSTDGETVRKWPCLPLQ